VDLEVCLRQFWSSLWDWSTLWALTHLTRASFALLRSKGLAQFVCTVFFFKNLLECGVTQKATEVWVVDYCVVNPKEWHS
jgi:hypothetical protein